MQQTNSPSPNRNIAFDYIRILACVMVVLMHCPIPQKTISTFDSYFLSTISYITTPCIGLFFMLSGALLLPSEIESYKKFFTHRFKRIAIPTIVWSFVYIIYDMVADDKSVSDMLTSIISIPITPQEGVLWYVYTLIGIYLLLPILSPWFKLSSNRQILFYLSIWSITLLFPYLKGWINLTTGETGILYYFSGYVGYFILGAILTRRYAEIKAAKVSAIAILLCLIIPAPLKLFNAEIDFYSMFWYLSMPVAIMCASWFIIARSWPRPSKSSRLYLITVKISSYTFGIYLCHILFRRIIFDSYIFNDLNIVLSTTASFLLMFGCSLSLCLFIKRTPFSKYIIGI